MINWNDGPCQVTTHFTVKDCLFLHAWNRLAIASDGVNFDKLRSLCDRLETVRTILQTPMEVHCMFRSPSYNLSQGITPIIDVHAQSIACDFSCPRMSIEEVKDHIRPWLKTLEIRMEKGTPTWVHIDMRQPGISGREFTA